MAFAFRLAFAIVVAMFASAAMAQNYPVRAIRLVVSFPPGGAADIVARLLAQPLSVRLGQPVVVDNRPGANGNISAEVVAKAPPDGYTLLLGPSALFGINPHLYARMSIDPHKDLLPVASVQLNTLLLTSSPKLTAIGNFRDFIAVAREAKAPLFYGSIGNGSEHHLAMEMLKGRAGIDLVHVPYRGGGPAAIGVMAGDVAAMFGGGSVGPLVQSGQLRGLASSGARRSPLLPDLPAIAEFYPGYEVALWNGLFAPAGTPPAIVDLLRTEVRAILTGPDFGPKLMAGGSGEAFVTTPEELAARLRTDYEAYGRVIREIGAKVD